MTRQRLVNGKLIDLTTEEEAIRDEEEAAFTNRKIPTKGEIDMDMVNQVLAQEGSVLRGVVLVMLDEVNALRQKASMPLRTIDQIKPAIQTKMRP